MSTAWTGWVLGLLLGMRHALEPDHLAALSTLAIETRGTRRGAWLGAFWGIGHASSLIAVGMVLALFEARLPARLADIFELLVVALLVGFGVRAIVRARRHRHDHDHDQPRSGRSWRQSLVIGLAHGLAGSGVLVALVMAALPTTSSRLIYILLFGLGSTVGMSLLSAAAGWPLARLARSPRLATAVAIATGLLSIVLGAAWGIPVASRMLAHQP